VCQKPKLLLERSHAVPIRESRNHMRHIYNPGKETVKLEEQLHP
jgi:hypothetical protein